MKKTAKIITAGAAAVIAAGLIAFVLILHNKEEEVPVAQEIPVVTETETTTVTTTSEIPETTTTTAPPELSDRARELLEQNKDTVGWIKINNTQVDYPFVRDPGEVDADNTYYGGEAYGWNSYYLSHDFYRNYWREGTLFMDFRDEFGGFEEEQSENIVIYGHNMANGNMFGSVRRYRQDYGFYDQEPFIQLSSNYKDYDYVIFGFCVTSGNWYGDFIYWDMEELDTKEDFDYYVNTVRSKQMIDTGVDVKYGDKLLTLSTCYADEDNSRFIIVARRLREGEVAGDFSSIEKTDAYIKAHSTTTSAGNSAQTTTTVAAPGY
ncbi:MAG: class B sortase [Ruminococcus sp.]|nr:class B sortase [Ruminococcus sp.]